MSTKTQRWFQEEKPKHERYHNTSRFPIVKVKVKDKPEHAIRNAGILIQSRSINRCIANLQIGKMTWKGLQYSSTSLGASYPFTYTWECDLWYRNMNRNISSHHPPPYWTQWYPPRISMREIRSDDFTAMCSGSGDPAKRRVFVIISRRRMSFLKCFEQVLSWTT